MKNGRLNKPELARVARCFRDLDALLESLPRDGQSEDEANTAGLLVDSRNKLGELLRWQDYHGAWKAANARPNQPS